MLNGLTGRRKRSDSNATETLNPELKRRQVSFIPVKNENTVVVTVFFMGLAILILSLSSLMLAFSNRNLATRGRVYVQLPGGTTEVAQEFDELHRDRSVLRRTAVTWMQLTFEWGGTTDHAERDPVEVEDVDIPYSTYLASYLLQPGFRQEFLKQFGQRVLPTAYRARQSQSVLRFYRVSEPRLIAEGRWEVDIVATRIMRDSSGEQAELPINRTLVLEAITPIENPLEEEETSVWKREMYSLLKNGLMITEVRPLQLSNRGGSNAQ